MKVYFYQRKTHRKRQRETVEHCPDEIEVIKPDEIDYIKDTVLSNRNINKKLNFKNKLVKFLPLNFRILKDTKIYEADYIYMWGCIPIVISKPYILELDNPYVICYYNLFWFKLLKPIWKRILLSDKLKHIVCISEACQKSVANELGEKVLNKTKVIYPYMAEQPKVLIKEKHSTVEFLFVSTQFLLKGGREVLHAFKTVAKQGYNFHVTIVSNLDEKQQKQYASPYVTFVKANLEKSVLHEKYFTKADVFILPTYQDSFGMVYLEALSFGLPIIATRIYATPEMVYDNQNGFLVDAPVHFYLEDYKLNPKYRNGGIVQEITASGLYRDTACQLSKCIIKLMDEPTRNQMSACSLKIFEEKFSPNVRNKAFLSIFKD